MALGGFDIIHNAIGFGPTTFDRRGQVILNIVARNGVMVRIDASSNLLDWTPIGSVLNNQGTIQFADPDTLKFNQRFYRAVLP